MAVEGGMRCVKILHYVLLLAFLVSRRACRGAGGAGPGMEAAGDQMWEESPGGRRRRGHPSAAVRGPRGGCGWERAPPPLLALPVR